MLGLKLAGAFMVLAAALGYGLCLASRWRQRLWLLQGLRRLTYFLKGEITYSRAPLPEALRSAGARGGGVFGELFIRAAGQIERQEGESFGELWAGQVEELEKRRGELALAGEDLKSLKELGSHLGYLDLEMQERTIGLYLEQLDLTIADLQERRRETCRLYTSLGLMGGLFLVILLF